MMIGISTTIVQTFLALSWRESIGTWSLMTIQRILTLMLRWNRRYVRGLMMVKRCRRLSGIRSIAMLKEFSIPGITFCTWDSPFGFPKLRTCIIWESPKVELGHLCLKADLELNGVLLLMDINGVHWDIFINLELDKQKIINNSTNRRRPISKDKLGEPKSLCLLYRCPDTSLYIWCVHIG